MRRWGLRLVRWLRTRWGWDERHVELASHPLLAGVSRITIRRLALDGDEVEFDAGQELLREDHIGYWFFLVLDGSALARRRGDVVDHIAAGGHFGDVAILGFRPQPATFVAEAPMRAWVFGRRQFLGLAYSEPLVQRRLFPGTDGVAFAAKLRELRAVGTAEWHALSERPEWREAVLSSPLREVRPGRTVRRPPPSLLPPIPFTARARTGPDQAPLAMKLGWRAWTAIASVIATTAALVGFVYHPPVVVVTGGAPIDITADVAVDGVTIYPVHGRYLLLPVRLNRPNMFGVLAAAVHHRTRVPLAAGESREARAEASREARAAFGQSQVDALNAAALALRIDPHRVHATFRHREISGPSAGLIYALALYDLLGPDDLARGRTVVATGSIDAAGGVGPIGFIKDKQLGAAVVHADLFFVPASQADAVPRAIGVARLADALKALAA